MNLQIQSFADAGDAKKERLVLKAKANIDVGAYIILCSASSSDGKPTAGCKVAYWFPDTAVKTNDLVVLYTKSGDRSTKKLDSGVTVHFFYWGQDRPIWDSSDFGAVVILADDWSWKMPLKK